MRRLGRLILATLLAATLIPAPPASAVGDVAWNIHCGVSHFKSDDPIVFPGKPGESHAHTFFGNTTTDAASNTQSLLASSSTCERGFENADHSGYWVPSIYRKSLNGTLTELKGTPEDMSVTIYYRRAGDEPVVMIPQGLRMIAGDPHAHAETADAPGRWSCRDIKTGASFGESNARIPNCPSTHSLFGTLTFPNCWDGVNLDSADHKSHVVYTDNGACPASHRKKIPQLTFELFYHNATGPGEQFMLSSGGQYSLHGDVFSAWDNRVQSALVNSCLNAGKQCTGVNLSEVNLGSATVSGNNDFATPSATPTALATPASQPVHSQKYIQPLLQFAVILGIGIGGYFFRRRLRQR
ncbi:MAG: uncharacterized protein K0S68_821 [Candidatus Saccharibacteria bacterium]|nr:uncharacterized protein [Candidatus Saccharibacteria bacterium]